MANSIAFYAVPDLSLKERLFLAMVTGPLEQGEELLNALEEVDDRLVNQRTLLHVGVGLGKLDWVEELLARGADPNLVDDSHTTAMSSAEEMLRRWPEDMNRRQVRRLVRMVNRRDQAMRFRPQTSAARGAASSTPPVLQPELLSSLAAFSSSSSAMKEEMRTLTAELRSSLEELKGRLCGRDELLRSLETSVTCSAELLTSLSGRLQGGTTMGAMGTTLETPLPLFNMADERRECMDGMMRRTEVVYGGEEGVRFVRKLYKRLYDEDDITACLLTFLQRESRFVVKVDCYSRRIERMKERYVGLDGDERSGSVWPSFADFSSNTVYFGAKVEGFRSEESAAGLFALALARMSLHLCFKNGGKPYEGGDNVCETEWKRAFEEVEEEKRKRGDGLHLWIRWALDRKTQAARESYLAACVPLIIAEVGSNEGTRVLQEQAPLLLRYFKEHVLATLLAKARVYFGATPEFYPLQGSLKEERRITNHLAVPLAQLCIHMAFQNEGRPYDEDAGHLEELFGRVLKEAEERITKVKKSPLHEWVPRDFERRTRLGKEIELICLPLAISAHFDSDTMVNVLLRELPSLLVFYDHFVQPKLEGNLQSATK